MSYERSISVIGLGRVGLPLALASRTADTHARRRPRPRGVDSIRAGGCPGARPARGAAGPRSRPGPLRVAKRAADAARADEIVLTIGTPSSRNRERHATSGPWWTTCCRCCAPGHPLVLRSTVAPGTTELWRLPGETARPRGRRRHLRGARARAIAADRFMEESHAPVHRRRRRRGPRKTRGAAARVGAPIVQTTPVQAELAKIWTDILRYATLAAQHVMMDCERYDANVYEVIDLITATTHAAGSDAGLTAGTGLRKDFMFSEERSGAPGMLLAVSRVHETVPLFLVDGVKRRLGSCGRAGSPSSGWRSGATRRRARLALEKWSGCSSASWPTWPCTTAVRTPTAARSRRRSKRRTSWSSRPTIPRTRPPRRYGRSMSSASKDCCSSIPWNASAPPSVRVRRRGADDGLERRRTRRGRHRAR